MILLSSKAATVIDKINLVLPSSAKKVAFITTAGNPYAGETPWIEEDRRAVLSSGRTLDVLDLAQLKDQQLIDRLTSADIIFVCGGNAFYLLQESNRSGFSSVLPALLDQGRHYIGSSAGASLVGTSLHCLHLFDDPLAAPSLSSDKALALVPFVPLVHFGREKYFAKYLETFKVAYSIGESIVSIRDDQLLLWSNNSIEWR